MQRSTRFNRPTLRGSSIASVLFNKAEAFNLKAEPDTTTSISLAWNEPSQKPDNYRVERSTDGITFSTVTTLANTDFTYTDTGLTESTEYWYRIVPILGGADQSASNVANTWTVPDTPTSLTATAISSTQIDLAWTDVSTGNTAQSIQRRSPAGSGSYSFIASVGATANSYSDTGLIAATQYEYQVAATNPATQSAWSTAANATTTGGGPPSASWTLDFSTGEPWSNGTNYTFSSTASTSRTFVNSSGYVAPCVANLLQRSEEFNNAYYTLLDATVTANDTTAPDNTTTADLLKENSASAVHSVYKFNVANSSGTDYTFSVFAKSQNRTAIAIQFMYDGNSRRATQLYDLSGGAVSGSVFYNGASVTASAAIENFGNGWYRCIFTVNVPAGDFTVFVDLSNSLTPTRSNGHPTYTGNGTDGAYIWGAQLVTGSAPLPYSATTTSSNGIPRLTHNSSGSRLGLLVEGQRTNLAVRSQEFQTTWTNSNTTETTDAATAPDNTLTADELIESAGTTVSRLIQQNLSWTSGTTYTVSVYAKANTATCLQLVGGSSAFGSNEWATFDVSAGTVGSVGTSVTGDDATIEDVGNGWYRCKVTMVATGTATASCPIVLTNNTSTTTRLPTYTVTAGNERGLYIWGYQAEAGASASSYIPTVGSAITRSADLAYVETADVTNWGRPGSFVVEYYKPLEQSGGVVVADDDGAGNAGRLGVEYSSGGPRIVYGTSGSGAGGTDTAGLNKIGWAWDGSGAATRSALNGSALDTSLATSFDPTLTDGINLGGNIDWTSLPLTVSGQPNVVIRKVQFWNSQLSAADLNTLTT